MDVSPSPIAQILFRAWRFWQPIPGLPSRALKNCKVDWEFPDSRDNTDDLFQRFEQALDDDAEQVRRDGEPEFTDAEHSLDATYQVPYLAHIPMEPMNCTAHVQGDKAEVWAPTQNPPMAAEAVAKVLGIPQENVTIHVMRSGGAFGRRFYADFITDTVSAFERVRTPDQSCVAT